MSQMPPGLPGLVVAAILSAALSSLSSGINSTCAVLDRDFLSRRAATSIVGDGRSGRCDPTEAADLVGGLAWRSR